MRVFARITRLYSTRNRVVCQQYQAAQQGLSVFPSGRLRRLFLHEGEEYEGDAVAPMLLTLTYWRGAQRRADGLFERTEKPWFRYW